MGQARILIIGDDRIDAQFIGISLKSKDFDVTVSENVKDAFSLVVRELPDLIILDSDQGRGTDFCRMIRQFTDIPIIILSENPRKFEELNCLESGADDFIIKPYSVEILSLKVKAVMRRRKAGAAANSLQDDLQLTFNMN